jgi:hypothetical protein
MPWPKIDSNQRVSGGRNRGEPYPRPATWKRVVNPMRNPEPPRPRPTIFFYVFTLIYAQAGFTRKFRHFLPCQHNITYFAIPEQNKRHLYALGSECVMCVFCEETVITHQHLSIFECPCDSNCPKTSKISPQQMDAKVQHYCGHHQSQVPHPMDLNSIPNLPVPMGAPSQFSFHSSFPMDSMMVANALQDKATIPGFQAPSFHNNLEIGMLNVNNPPVNSVRPPQPAMMRPPMYPPPPPYMPSCTCPPPARKPPADRVPTPIPSRKQPQTPPPSPIQEQVDESVEIEVEVEIAADE